MASFGVRGCVLKVEVRVMVIGPTTCYKTTLQTGVADSGGGGPGGPGLPFGKP